MNSINYFLRNITINKLINDCRKNYTINNLFYIVLLILLFCIFKKVYFDFLPLNEELYKNKYLILGLLERPKFIIAYIICNGLLIYDFKSITWKSGNNDSVIRYFIFLLSLVIAWSFSTYDYNLYFNQSHYPSRILLILLSILILYHPIFVGLFLILSIVVASQFGYPDVFYYSWTDKIPLFNLLILFNAYLYLRIFNKGKLQFVILILCFTASNYFYSGLEKLKYGWFSNNELNNLIISGYLNGWMSILDQDTIIKVSHFVELFNKPFLILTLLVELSSLFILFNRTLSSIIVFGFILLHFFIFIFSGIFFWKWMLLNLFILILIYRLDFKYCKAIFSKQGFILSVLLILFSPIYLNPLKLGWLDSRVNNFYEIKLVGESGRLYNMNRNFMSPYDIVFSQNRFYFLNKETILTDTYGTCFNIDTCNKLKNITKANIMNNNIKALKGKIFYDETKINRFIHFMKIYFAILNRRMSKDVIFNRFSPPYHLNNFSPKNRYNFQEKIKEVLIIYVKTYYDGEKIHYLNNKLVCKIDIPTN